MLCRSSPWDCLWLLLLAITRLRRKVGLGRFSFSSKLRKFRFGIFGTNFEDGQLWPVRLFRSAITNCPFPFDKTVVPSTALLNPAYKNSNQTRSGLEGGSLRKKIEPFHWARWTSEIKNRNFYWMEERPKFLPKMVSGEIRRKTDPVSEQLHKSQNGLYRGLLCLFLALSLFFISSVRP